MKINKIIIKTIHLTIVSFLLAFCSLLIGLNIDFEEILSGLITFFTIYLLLINLIIVFILEKNKILQNFFLKRSVLIFLIIFYALSIYILKNLGNKNDVYITILLGSCILLSICLYNKWLFKFFKNSVWHG